MVFTGTLQIETQGDMDIIDITPRIAGFLGESKLASGVVTVYVSHTTAGVSVIECETGLLSDFKRMFERVYPTAIRYEHDNHSTEGNGYAHVRASMVGPSVAVPFVQGTMSLGIWQRIVLVDFDNGPRSRHVIVQIMGA